MRTIKIIYPLLLLVVLLAFGCDEDNETDFRANLVGGDEVPPVTTTATGTANFTHNEEDNTIQFSVNVTGISNVIAAHIHQGAVGVNGPIVVTLFDGPQTGTNFTGTLSSGTINSGDVSGMSLEQLVVNMRAGQMYVNVHTTQNPAGEIRGQLSVLD